MIRVFIISILVAIFIASFLLNITLFTIGEGQIALTNRWIILPIIGLFVVTILSLTIAFWNYHVRSLYLKEGPALVPEKWGRILIELIEQSTTQHQDNRKSLEKLEKASENQEQKSDEIMSSFLTLQRALNIRDEEIIRLKKGYDSQIFKRFLLRFIRIDRSLNDLKDKTTDQEQQKNYKYLSRLMEDALEECSVEQFIPEVGVDYRDVGSQVAEDPKLLETQDMEQDFKIAEIESVGYLIKEKEEIEVIVPSKVTIYRYNSTQRE